MQEVRAVGVAVFEEDLVEFLPELPFGLVDALLDVFAFLFRVNSSPSFADPLAFALTFSLAFYFDELNAVDSERADII